ncbi:MAG: Crp/Fnr family transcriptional regulator [Deltaproteobacteria bacterium]|nr:Crp/Fnr family transcriptional regulator [Deltaproteobacteria bacterium]
MLTPADVRKIPRFSGLSPDAEHYLCEKLLARQYAKGEAIFMEGDDSDRFFLVQEGEVKIYKMLESGREVILGLFRGGEAFGEVAMLDGFELPASAIAHENTRVVSLSRRDYLTLLEQFPEVARRIIRDLTLRLHTMRRHIEMLGESGVTARISRLLLTYAGQHGEKAETGLLVPLRLTRQELASLVGARIETVIRIMSRWQKEGVVQSTAQGFLIPDQDVLEALISHED